MARKLTLFFKVILALYSINKLNIGKKHFDKSRIQERMEVEVNQGCLVKWEKLV